MLPADTQPVQIAIANTTYAALSMKQGDGFAKQFGGPTGNDPDWLRLTIEGLNVSGTAVAATSLYLADYRPPDSAAETILADRTGVDLSPLSGLPVTTLSFRLESSDRSSLGLNTPAYFAADNLVLDLPTLPGDIDRNGQIDAQDLAHWQQTFGDAPGADLIAWQRAWAPTPATFSAVPQPPTMAMIAGVVLAWRQRRQQAVSYQPSANSQ